MSLRGLINTRIIASILLIMMIASLLAIWKARQSVEQEVTSSFNLALQMIDLGFGQSVSSARTEQQWLLQLSRIQQTRHLHIALVDEQGETVDWFSRSFDEDEKQPPGWFVKLVSTEYPTARYQIELVDGRSKQIVLEADPLDEIAEAWGETITYFWSVVVMMLVIVFAINVVFHSMLRSVQAILSGLRQVESGQYGQKLPRFRISEFDAIAREVDNLSEALSVAQHNNQALARHTLQIQESERRTLSRELHDEMGQSLTAIKAMAVALKQPGADCPAIAASIIEICNRLSGVVRSMMRTLHPLSLSELGLGATLDDLVNEWRRRQPDLAIKLKFDERIDSLNHELAIHVYRIVQECLTNVVRHAQANEVVIDIGYDIVDRQPRVTIRVADNGRGGVAEGHGFGVRSMRERVENMGGQFQFQSSLAGGVCISAWMPFVERQGNDSEQD